MRLSSSRGFLRGGGLGTLGRGFGRPRSRGGLPAAIIGLGALGGYRRRRASLVGMVGVAVVALLVLAMISRAVPGQPLQDRSPGQAEIPLIDAKDTEELKKHTDQRVTVEGKISRAAWSRSGAVCDIYFEGVGRDGFLAVIFERNRKAFDDAFGGDVARTIAGARVRITGTMGEYGGHVEEHQGRPQIVMSRVHQLTIVQLAGDAAAGN